LEAQKSAVSSFTKNCEDCIIAEFIERENSSGKNDKRVELDKAMKLAKEKDATLLIAKLDRLSRNASFIFSLRDAKVSFTCCDMPDANTLTIGIFAVMAQHERETISKRTKAALDEKKKQVGEWRTGSFTDESRQKAYDTHRRKAAENENNQRATDYAKMLRQQGKTYLEIANYLNERKLLTSQGKQFQKTTIKRLLEK
jgi:DNA invertase Pin-like site-specific DNA recombinase